MLENNMQLDADVAHLVETFGKVPGKNWDNAAGIKKDDGKLRYDLYPPEAMEGTVKILTIGANKYSDRNWEKGMQWSRVFGALMRHLWKWFSGEDNDLETGESHLDHAACCIAFLQTYSKRKIGKDDRVKNERTGST